MFVEILPADALRTIPYGAHYVMEAVPVAMSWVSYMFSTEGVKKCRNCWTQPQGSVDLEVGRKFGTRDRVVSTARRDQIVPHGHRFDLV